MGTNLAFVWLCFLPILQEVRSQSLQNGTSWSDLQISPKAIDHMPYRNHHVFIYESLDNQRLLSNNSQQKHYFCTPILLLQPSKVKYKYINATRHHAVTFDIVMWNDHVKQAVFDYMNKEMNITVEKRQIKPIPFEQLLLVCDTAADSCKCPKEWRPYHMRNVVHFSMVCPSKPEAMSLTEVFHNDPEQFHSVFKMMFSLSTRKSRQREAVINVHNIHNGKMMSKLEQRFPDKSEVLLMADDANKLLAESSSNIMSQIYSENDEVINDQSENFVYNMIQQMMVNGIARVDGDFKMWDSVFWNADNYRPDELAHELNESRKKLDSKNQKRLVDAMAKASKNASEIAEIISLLESKQQEKSQRLESDTSDSVSEERLQENGESKNTLSNKAQEAQTRDAVSGGVSVGFSGVSASTNMAVEKERMLSISNAEQNQNAVSKASAEKKQEEKTDKKGAESNISNNESIAIEKQSNVKIDHEDSDSRNTETDEGIRKLEESLSRIEWNGKKFVPKVMTLTRINLANMRSDQTLKDQKISVSFASAMLSLPVNINLDSQSDNYSLYDEILDKVRQLTNQMVSVSLSMRRLSSDVKAVPSKCRNELHSEVGQLKRELTLRENKLNEIIEQAKDSLRQELSTSLSATNHSISQDLAELKETSSHIANELNNELLGIRSTISDVETELKSTISNLNTSVFTSLTPKEKAFFFAFGKSTEGPNKTVTYSKGDLVNVDWKIDPSEGVFFVPRDGYYALFFNAVSRKSSIVSLMCNGRQLISTVTRSDSEGESAISLSTVQRLKANDKISVLLQDGELKNYATFQYSHNAESHVAKLYDTIAFSGFSID